jgi:serine acetyltransferase
MIHGAVESLVRRIKRDDGYALSGDLRDRDLIEVVLRRGFEAVRGVWIGRKLGAATMPLFAGHRVVIRHGHMIRIGRGCILGDDVLLDGLGSSGLRLGANVTIGRASTLVCTGVIARPGVGIVIGSRTGISEGAHIEGQGGVTIGSDVIIGPAVRIFSENHRFRDPLIPIREQGEERAPVRIADNCWIGSGTILLAGVSIGPGSVIGAGSIVTHDVPAGSLALGAPARVVGARVPGVAPTSPQALARNGSSH